MPGTSSKTRPPLDEKLYPLAEDQDSLQFVQSQTGIQDEEELKQHVLRIQAQAYAIHGYPCIRSFSFLRPKMSRLSGYREALRVLQKNKDAIFLDLGCCFGTDLRKAVLDGWPVANVIGSDLHKEFWYCGHDMFRSTPETFPAAFVPGDVFDPDFIQPRRPFYSNGDDNVPPPDQTDLSSLTWLTPLQGRVSVIHLSSFFHLFSESKQLEAARQLATLLSPSPGSVIFGMHMARSTKGPRQLGKDRSMFCHSPESWKEEVWDGLVFEKGTVEVKARMHEVERPNFITGSGMMKIQLLIWSVTRL